jgi:hypothetical protein
MSSRGRYEDISTLLYLVPFVVPVLYGIVLWAQSGPSWLLPTSVYLTVTRDPIVFIAASLSIMLGVMLEVNASEPSQRPSKLISLGNTLQSIAIASLVITVISALYANGFDPIGTGNDFIIGRYGLVFPALMVLLSYLITAQFRFSSLANTKVLAIVALLLVPASLYELGRHQTALGLGVAFVLLLVGLGMYLLPQRKTPSPKEE